MSQGNSSILLAVHENIPNWVQVSGDSAGQGLMLEGFQCNFTGPTSLSAISGALRAKSANLAQYQLHILYRVRRCGPTYAHLQRGITDIYTGPYVPLFAVSSAPLFIGVGYTPSTSGALVEDSLPVIPGPCLYWASRGHCTATGSIYLVHSSREALGAFTWSRFLRMLDQVDEVELNRMLDQVKHAGTRSGFTGETY